MSKAVRDFEARRSIYGSEPVNNAEEVKAIIEAQEKLSKENQFRDSVVEANREKLAEETAKREEKLFLDVARRDFFLANPTATESEFKRLLPKLRDEYLLESFRELRAKSNDVLSELYDELH